MTHVWGMTSTQWQVALGSIQVDLGLKLSQSLGIEERSHQPLGNTFRNAKLSMARYIPDSTILSICVKAMNDRLGLKELVPSTPAF